MEARKDDVGKIRYDLIPVEPLRRLAEVYTIGARKYSDRNWERGMQWGRIYAAMQRHANAWWGGETNDPVDGQHHLASVAWAALALLEFERTHPELDDRPTTYVAKSSVITPYIDPMVQGYIDRMERERKDKKKETELTIINDIPKSEIQNIEELDWINNSKTLKEVAKEKGFKLVEPDLNLYLRATEKFKQGTDPDDDPPRRIGEYGGV